MLNTRELGLIALVRAALKQRKEALPENFNAMQLLPLIRRHQIVPMIIDACAYYDREDVRCCVNKLMQSSALSLSITETQCIETEALCVALEEEKIDYALLKGSEIKDYYPQKHLRTMADVDILIRKEQYEKIVPIMQRLGFTQGVESDHEYNWQKGRVHVELHKYLIPSYNKRYFSVFGDGWDLMHPIRSDSTRYAMSNEDQFLYVFTHYAKHFRDGGIGVKHLTDLWVCRKACPKMNEAYIIKRLKKLALDEFYENVMQTVAFWFEGAQLSEKAELITHEIISSGAYGREETQKKAEAVRNTPQKGKRSKLRWTMCMIFLPYKNMCMKYPFLRYLPFLLPIMWVVRWFTALCFKTKETKKNIRLAQNMSQESVDNYRNYLMSLGLSFDEE